MKRKPIYTISLVIVALLFSFFLPSRAFALIDSSSYNKARVLSKVDLRKYFEKAMTLFETGKYEEAVIVFENLIEIEKNQNESYFTPFAEIYIDKSRSRMKELMILEERKWARMKKDVVEEAERIAREEALDAVKEKSQALREPEELSIAKKQKEDAIRREHMKEKALEEEVRRKRAEGLSLAKKEKEDALRKEEMRKKVIEDARRKRAIELTERVNNVYEKAARYYRDGNYPLAIVEFKKIREMDPQNKLVARAESFIEKAKHQIKKEEEEALLARMEAARLAKIEAEREERRIEIERQRKEREKEHLKKIFEARLREKERREKIIRVEELMDTIRAHVENREFDRAKESLYTAMAEFPENERFKDILQHVEMEKIKQEEKALKRTRDIIEEKMLLEVAEKHLLPEETYGILEKKKEITPLVRVPEIRKRLKIPISVDFKEIELDYVLSFLSDATGVNIIPSSEIDMEEKKVTIKIKDMPLEEALRYILKSQDLIYRIEEDAVWVATKEELDNEQVETRVYFLNQGIGRFAEFSGTYTEEGGSSASTEVKTIKVILEEAVDWPKDSKMTMDDRTGALIISNIPSNLEVIENLVYTLDVTPKQVLIEARFLEVKVTDVDELGFEWKLNSAWGTTQNNAKQNKQGFASDSGVDFSAFSNVDYGFNLTYQGILSHPQFQAVLHAFQQKQNVKTLSVPRITTLNNQTATIEVIDEYIYPTRYEVSLVQYDINGDGDFDDAGETEWANIPQDFVTRDVGILLHVKPSVGVDDKTITLALTPEVSEQDSTTSSYSYSGNVSIPNFKTRNLSTSVIVESGETVVMGGLISESNTKTKTKVPLLGDLPLVGGLFRRNYENVERRNLLIFVTAHVLNEKEDIIASAPTHEIDKREQ